jgi:hypothetical protein
MFYNATGLKNYGFLDAKLSDAELAPIKTEIDNIQKNFDSYENQKHNMHLAGNIKREYRLTESKKYIEDLLMPLVGAYNGDFDYMKNFNVLSTDVPIILDSCWVNFQKKYEFNPAHKHFGLLSFVIWINVPYDIEDECKLSPGVESNFNSAGMFSFLYNDTISGIRAFDIPVDKSMENKIILFPSSFFHMVYPFFSSDGYRISVSGNFKLKID